MCTEKYVAFATVMNSTCVDTLQRTYRGLIKEARKLYILQGTLLQNHDACLKKKEKPAPIVFVPKYKAVMNQPTEGFEIPRVFSLYHLQILLRSYFTQLSS